MEVTKKKLVKESIFWVVLIAITFIGTNIYSETRPEKKIDNSYHRAYGYLEEGKKMMNNDIEKVQESLDKGRKEIKDTKIKFKLSDGLVAQFNSISSEFDKLQEEIITKAKEKIKEMQKSTAEEKIKLQKEVEGIINSLENGDSKRAKSAAENLKKILEENKK